MATGHKTHYSPFERDLVSFTACNVWAGMDADGSKVQVSNSWESVTCQKCLAQREELGRPAPRVLVASDERPF